MTLRLWSTCVLALMLAACAVIQTDSFRADVGCKTERDKDGHITHMKCDKHYPLRFEFRW